MWKMHARNLIYNFQEQYPHISLRFNGHFPGEPGLAGVFIEEKDYGSGGDNWSYKSCKAPVKSSPPTNQHPVFLQTGCPSCRPVPVLVISMNK